MLPHKVLIIDDEKMIRLTTGILLKKENIEVICAGNGKEGITLAEKELPDLILLDIMMPVMDGWQVLDAIQSSPTIQHIPVVIFTAGEIQITLDLIKDKDIHGMIRKPFRLEKLLEMCEIPDNKR